MSITSSDTTSKYRKVIKICCTNSVVADVYCGSRMIGTELFSFAIFFDSDQKLRKRLEAALKWADELIQTAMEFESL